MDSQLLFLRAEVCIIKADVDSTVCVCIKWRAMEAPDSGNCLLHRSTILQQQNNSATDWPYRCLHRGKVR